MTEKRFMLDDAGELIDLNNHKFIDYGEECCNLLNELADESEQLKKEIETGKEYCKTLETDLGNCADNRILLQKENNELDTENRKLKNELNLSKLNLKEKNEGFDKLHKMYMEQIEENKELKGKCEFMEKILENKGYTVEYDTKKDKWVLE